MRSRILFVFLLVGGVLSAKPQAVAAAPPNIVVYLSDDHGAEFAGCYGNPAIHTPNIDALARAGTRFTQVFAASPTCSPSRAALYTGLYPPRNGLMGNHTTCKPDVKSLPMYLKPLGYRVVLANKTHVQPESVFPFEMLPGATLPRVPGRERRYRTEGLNTAAVDRFLEAHARDHAGQPLCLILADSGPHVVWEKNTTYDPARLPVPPNMVDTPKTRTGLANYYQDITTVDRRVGEVSAALAKRGFADNTLFIYTSDQGPEWPHCKWTVYDTGLGVPFIARWPGKVKAGAVCDALMSLVDVTPTFLDLAGGSPPPGLDGRSFKDVLLGKAETFRDTIFASHTGDKEFNQFPQRCVRDRRYKYVLNLYPDRKWTTHFTLVPRLPDSHKDIWDAWVEKAKTDPAAARLIETIERHPAEELYDTQTDQYELTNLAGKPEMKPVLDRLREQLRQWRAAQNDVTD
jgi:arylsulfatase A-like enzyme